MHRGKIILIAAILLLVALAASAFDLAIGFEGGVDFPFFSGSSYESVLAAGARTKIRFGFSAGAFITLGIIDFLAIQPEVMYSYLGGNFGDSAATWHEKAGVIEIPVLLKFRLKFGSTRFCPLAGADVLIRLGDWGFEIKDSAGILIGWGTYYSQYIRVPIIGVLFGFGFEFPTTGGWWTLNARYHLGIMNRFTDGNPAGITDWRQSNIQVLLGYGFAVGR
jgi:hypothetical protein